MIERIVIYLRTLLDALFYFHSQKRIYSLVAER